MKNEYKAPNPKFILKYIRQFFWWCAGADPVLLNNGTYTDQIKMACLGGTVVSTASLAFIAGTYAFHTIFSTEVGSEISYYSYLFGFVWGLVIFNIDRFIVSSTPPKINLGLFSDIKQFFPRIIMGLVISLVISKPLELKIFEKDIELQIANKEADELRKIRESKVLKSIGENELLKEEIDLFKRKITSLEQKKDYYDSLYSVEARIITVGPRARAMKEERDKASLGIQSLETSNEYQSLLRRQENSLAKIDQEVLEEKENVQLGLGSLVNRLKIAHEVSPSISLAITLLFVIIELTPIFFKLTMEKSPFDYQLFARNQLIKAKAGIDDNNPLVKATYAIEETENVKKEQEELKRKFDRELQEKAEAFDIEINNLREEEKQRLELVHQKNLKKILLEGQNSLLEETEITFDIKKIEEELESLTKNLDTVKDRLHKGLEYAKLQSAIEVEKELLKVSQEEFVKIERQKIINNAETDFPNRVDLNGSSNGLIEDDLIQNKFWERGENYNKIYAFTKPSIGKLLESRSIFKNDDIINEIFQSEENKVKTDSKISQKRKDQDIFDWASEETNKRDFNLDPDKISRNKEKVQGDILKLARKKEHV